MAGSSGSAGFSFSIACSACARSAAGSVAISALIPLAELDDYQGRLKSLTAGQGSYSISFSHYAQVPDATQRLLASKYKALDLDDESAGGNGR